MAPKTREERIRSLFHAEGEGMVTMPSQKSTISWSLAFGAVLMATTGPQFSATRQPENLTTTRVLASNSASEQVSGTSVAQISTTPVPDRRIQAGIRSCGGIMGMPPQQFKKLEFSKVTFSDIHCTKENWIEKERKQKRRRTNIFTALNLVSEMVQLNTTALEFA